MFIECIERYKPKKLSPEEKEILEKGMAQAFYCFQKTACDLYGFANVKKLRDDYKKNPLILKDHPVAKEHMDWMISKESIIISGYVLMFFKICKNNANCTTNKKLLGSPSFEDFLQEAVFAIYDSMYLYNGETKFITYVSNSVRNRLINFSNYNRKTSGCDRTIEELRKKVLFISKNEFLSQEQAIKKLTESEKIDYHTIERLKLSLGIEVRGIIDVSKHQVKKEESNKSYIEKMRRSISNTELSDMERQLVEAHLKGDSDFRRKLSETINPNTGKLWTKQRLSQIFLGACEKIRKVYDASKAA